MEKQQQLLHQGGGGGGGVDCDQRTPTDNGADKAVPARLLARDAFHAREFAACREALANIHAIRPNDARLKHNLALAKFYARDRHAHDEHANDVRELRDEVTDARDELVRAAALTDRAVNAAIEDAATTTTTTTTTTPGSPGGTPTAPSSPAGPPSSPSTGNPWVGEHDAHVAAVNTALASMAAGDGSSNADTPATTLAHLFRSADAMPEAAARRLYTTLVEVALRCGRLGEAREALRACEARTRKGDGDRFVSLARARLELLAAAASGADVVAQQGGDDVGDDIPHIRAHAGWLAGDTAAAGEALLAAPAPLGAADDAAARACLPANAALLEARRGNHNTASLLLARAMRELAVSPTPDPLTGDMGTRLMYALGVQKLRLGDYVGAFACLTEAAPACADSALYWMRLAECCIAHHAASPAPAPAPASSSSPSSSSSSQSPPPQTTTTTTTTAATSLPPSPTATNLSIEFATHALATCLRLIAEESEADIGEEEAEAATVAAAAAVPPRPALASWRRRRRAERARLRTAALLATAHVALERRKPADAAKAATRVLTEAAADLATERARARLLLAEALCMDGPMPAGARLSPMELLQASLAEGGGAAHATQDAPAMLANLVGALVARGNVVAARRAAARAAALVSAESSYWRADIVAATAILALAERNSRKAAEILRHRRRILVL